MKRESLILISIIAVAFIVRIWDMGWNGFNGDESIYSGQAASLLGEEHFLKDFAIFRAHPLLLQSLVSFAFAFFGIHDVVARMVPVIFGTLTVFMTYVVGKQLFDRKVGLISCLVLTFLPFHIVFSRQVLLDVPLSFFVMLFLYFITKYKTTGQNIFCFWTGISCGLCFISKEVGIITLPIFVIYSIITRTLKLNKFLILLSGFVLSSLPYFFHILTRQDAINSFFQFSTFQLSREATIFSLRYSSILINEAFGYVLSILLIVSVFIIWKESRKTGYRRYRDQIILLVLTLGTLFLFFQLLPSKGDRFMITLLPPAVILGCAFVVSDLVKHWRMHNLVYVAIIPLIVFSNNFFLTKAFPIEDLKISDYLGTPWNREAALWIKNNTPSNASVLTAESKLGNIVKFYSNHDVYTIELNRNPSYIQVDNPLLLIFNKNVTILVEDNDPSLAKTSAAGKMREYLELLKPKLLYTGFKQDTEDGNGNAVPIIKIYQVN